MIFDNNTMEIMLEHAKEEYPKECCGILLGSQVEHIKVVKKIVTMTNISKDGSKENNFLISPIEMIEQEKKAIKEGFFILGFYHSHPEYDAVPSKKDMLYMIPEQSYPIISIKVAYNKTNFKVRSFVKVINKEKHMEEIIEEEVECK